MTDTANVAAPPDTPNFAQHLLANAARANKASFDDAGTLTYGEPAERVKRSPPPCAAWA